MINIKIYVFSKAKNCRLQLSYSVNIVGKFCPPYTVIVITLCLSGKFEKAFEIDKF